MMMNKISKNGVTQFTMRSTQLIKILFAWSVILGTTAMGQTLTNPIPEQVDQMVSRFLKVQNTQIHIENVTEWAFSGRKDSMAFDVNLKDSTHFRLFVESQNIDILGYGEKLYTVNHGQRQIIIEPLNPLDLIKRFLGPLFSDVVFKSQVLEKSGHKLTFEFSDPYSEWSSAIVHIDKSWLVRQMDLADVDQNIVHVNLSYLNLMESFYSEDILTNSYQYRIADTTQKAAPKQDGTGQP